MSESAKLLIEPGGFSIEKDGAPMAHFRWGVGDWTVYLDDPRVPRADPNVPLSSLPNFSTVMGNPRVTSLDARGRDQDRDLLGFPKDPDADVVLDTNTDLSGNVTIRWGPLHIHSAPISDPDARALIESAFQQGFEVRRFAEEAGRYGTGRVLRTRISTTRAETTPEVTPVPAPGR